MENDAALHQRVRDGIEQGRLPAEEPLHTWAGAGDGDKCHACDRPIPTGDTEFELVFDGSAGRFTLRLHARCHALWVVEQRRR